MGFKMSSVLKISWTLAVLLILFIVIKGLTVDRGIDIIIIEVEAE